MKRGMTMRMKKRKRMTIGLMILTRIVINKRFNAWIFRIQGEIFVK